MKESEHDLQKIFNGECPRRWVEQGIKMVCGHSMPCPSHTDAIFWKANVLNQITDKFHIIPKSDPPEKWVKLGKKMKYCDELVDCKLHWRNEKG